MYNGETPYYQALKDKKQTGKDLSGAMNKIAEMNHKLELTNAYRKVDKDLEERGLPSLGEIVDFYLNEHPEYRL